MATRIISLTGSDSNPGTVLSPWATFAHAGPLLNPGDTLLYRGGTYPGNDPFDSNLLTLALGTSGSPITVSAYPGGLGASSTPGPRGGAEVVVFQPPTNVKALNFVLNGGTGNPGPTYWQFFDLSFDGSAQSAIDTALVNFSGLSSFNTLLHCEVMNCLDNGVTSSQTNGVATNLALRYCTLHDNGRDTSLTNVGYGFYWNTASNLVEGCDIFNNHGYGGQINAQAGFDASNNIVRYNRFHHNVVHPSPPAASFGGTTGGGFNFGCNDAGHCDNTEVYNNLIYNNGVDTFGTGGGAGSQGNGISIFNNASNSKVYNNTIYGNLGIGITLQYYSPTGNLIRNNILYGNRDGTLIDYGDINNNFGHFTNDFYLLTNPSFVNAAAGDFHLQAGSVAINAGVTLALVTDDFDRLSRPQGSAYCIGAYEFPAGSPPVNVLFRKLLGPTGNHAGGRQARWV